MLVVCLGDSITYGYPYGLEASWVYLAQQAVGTELVNKGNNGETTGEMLTRFYTDVIALSPTDVLVLGGTNDAWYELPLQTVRKNIISMLNLAKNHGIRFHLGLPMPVNIHALDDPYLARSLQTAPYLDNYRDWMRSYAAEEKINLIDFYTPLPALMGPQTLSTM